MEKLAILKAVIFFFALILTLQWIFGAIIWWTNKISGEKIIKEKHSPLFYNFIIFLSSILWAVLYLLSQ